MSRCPQRQCSASIARILAIIFAVGLLVERNLITLYSLSALRESQASVNITDALQQTMSELRESQKSVNSSTDALQQATLVWPPPPRAPKGPGLQPLRVPTLDYTYPLCPWIRNGDGSTYARVGPQGPRPLSNHINICIKRLHSFISNGFLIVSLDMGALLAAVTAGGRDVGVDDIDAWVVYEEGLFPSPDDLCPEVSWGNHGNSTLPRQSTVSREEYRRAYAASADKLCTCEFGNIPFTCFKSSLDDEPTPETLHPNEDWGDTWEGRHIMTNNTRLDNPRGSRFRSVRYLYPGYWVPPTNGGKSMRNDRIYHFANPDHALYNFQLWLKNDVRWCRVMSPSSRGSSLSLMELFSYVDFQIHRKKVNPSWIYHTLMVEPCLFLNTFDQLKHVCSYLTRVLAGRGNRTAEKILYEEWQGVPLRLGRGLQPSCLSILSNTCEQHGRETTVCGLLPITQSIDQGDDSPTLKL